MRIIDSRTGRITMKCGIAAFLGLLQIFVAPRIFAQGNPTQPTMDVVALVRRAVQYRLDSVRTHHPAQYLIRKVDDRRDSTKEVIETSDGDVACLVAIDGKQLTRDAEQAELDRLDNLAQHPELQEHRRKSEQKDAERIIHLLSLLPDAFQYQLEGIVPCASGQCYHLSFAPNPHFTPPDLEANIFRGIAGELWIDQAQERMTRLDAHFVADVDFGLGILGKLNKGGTVLLEQSNVGGNDWELTGLKIHVAGKALIVKSFNLQIAEYTSHYSPVEPGLHYRDAINLLKKFSFAATSYTPSTP